MRVMKTSHFVYGVRDSFMLNGDAVSGNHGSRAVRTALAVNENFSVGIVPDQIEELHNLSVGRIISAAPWNADIFHSQGFDFSLLNRSFLNVVPEINDNSYTEMLEGAKACQGRLRAAIETVRYVTEVGNSRRILRWWSAPRRRSHGR